MGFTKEWSKPPVAKLRFVFFMCNNPDDVVRFYGELLGIETEGSSELGFACVNSSVELLFFKGDYHIEPCKEWAWQPGYQGGQAHLTSFSLGFSELDFASAVARLQQVNADLLTKNPEWRRDSYWGITVRDPMGCTLELYTVPAQKPDRLAWNETEAALFRG